MFIHSSKSHLQITLCLSELQIVPRYLLTVVIYLVHRQHRWASGAASFQVQYPAALKWTGEPKLMFTHLLQRVDGEVAAVSESTQYIWNFSSKQPEDRHLGYFSLCVFVLKSLFTSAAFDLATWLFTSETLPTLPAM